MDLTGVRWRKSSYSGDNGGNCIEVTAAPGTAAGPGTLCLVRDSKDPDGPTLAVTPQGWQAFTRRVKNQELGLG
jgi:Domain of unknown function (DUF397)